MQIRYVERLWRAVSVPLCYLTFGVGGLLMGFVVVPLSSLIRPRVRRVRFLRSILHRAVRGWLELTARLGPMHYVFTGTIPRDHRYLVVANHPTLIDALCLLTLFPDACFIVKASLMHNPVTRFVLRGVDYISNADPGEMLDLAVARVRSGETLVVFPEGTRSPHDGQLDFKLGAATIALRAGVDCLPVTIHCDTHWLGKEDRWFAIPRDVVHCYFDVGPLIETQPVVGDLKPRYAKRELNRYLLNYFTTSLREIRLHGPGSARII